MTFLKMTNNAVARMQAAVVARAQRKARMAIGNVAQREKTDRGVRSMQRKERGAEIRKRANIPCEAWRTRPRAVTMLLGSATRGED